MLALAGSRVQYPASAGLPVQVQHMPSVAKLALPAQQGQAAAAAADRVHNGLAAQHPAVTGQPVEHEQVRTHCFPSQCESRGSDMLNGC